MNELNQLYIEMIEYYRGDPQQVQHLAKVHSYAKLIGERDGLDTETLQTLEAAAFVHDIGIKAAREKFGKSNGRLQEQEGPPLARMMLEALGFDRKVTERVCYLVAHHHTYTQVAGIDYRILLEADFLVNLYEEAADKDTISSAYEQIFRTDTGRLLCREMFQIEER